MASLEVTDEQQTASIIPSSQVQFWTMLLFDIPSLACTIFLLYHLLFNRSLRQALHNHVIIILLSLILIIEILDNPLYIDAHRGGTELNSFTMKPSICLVWWFVDNGFYGAIGVFLAWGSFERHILVFHQRQLLRTVRQRFYLHYLPLIILFIYLIGFYVVAVFFPPCENAFNFESMGCGLSPCYHNVVYLNLWDYGVNGIACTLIETTCSVGLLVRVFWQRRRANQLMNWRKHRKMVVQLLLVSSVSLTIILPESLMVFIRQIGGRSMSTFAMDADPYMTHLYILVVMILPFFCLAGLPELWPKLCRCNQQCQGGGGALTPSRNVEQVKGIKSRRG